MFDTFSHRMGPGLARAASALAPRSRLERGALTAGLAGVALSAGLAASAALAPADPSPLPDAATACPDGWAAEAAVKAGVTEAEMTARYLRAALTMPDGAVRERLRAPGVRGRIALCVAASRGMLPFA